MEVILLDNVANLGGLGDKVTVKPGFGRNFLLPYGKALPATKSNMEEFERRREELERAADARKAEAEDMAKAIAGLTVTIAANAGEEGKLFGSVGTRKIADAISEAARVEIDKSMIILDEGVLRDIGEYEIDIDLHAEVTQMVKVVVVPE